MTNKELKTLESAETRRNLHTHTHTHTGSFFLSLLSTMFVVSGAFATGVPSTETTADCDKPTLNTYTGTSNLAADWRANTIALHWYSDGEELNNIPTESQSCVYDSTLTPPPAPTKTGYTFKGWRVKQAAQCSFTASEVNGMSGVGSGHARLNGDGGNNEAQYGLTTPGEWATEFNTGIIKGMAKCSAKRGDSHGFWPAPSSDWSATESELTSASGEVKYCWCQATNYTPNGGNQCNVASPSWVFKSGYLSASYCANNCADGCAIYVLGDADLRRAVFGVQ